MSTRWSLFCRFPNFLLIKNRKAKSKSITFLCPSFLSCDEHNNDLRVRNGDGFHCIAQWWFLSREDCWEVIIIPLLTIALGARKMVGMSPALIPLFHIWRLTTDYWSNHALLCISFLTSGAYLLNDAQLNQNMTQNG